MSLAFSEPGMLWALLAVPLALLLALLARRERRIPVASMMPWRAVLALPRPRPRRNPLDLEVLAALLLTSFGALALAGPLLQWPAPEARRVIVLLDDSLRMSAANPNGTTRSETARQAFEDMQAAFPKATATVYLSSAVLPLAVEQPLAAISFPFETSAQPADALRRKQRVESLLRLARQQNAALLWIGDVKPGVEDPRLESILVGEAVGNVGLLQVSWNRLDPPELFVGMGNFSTTAAQGSLLFVQNDQVVAREDVDLPPGTRRGMVVTMPATLRMDLPVQVQMQTRAGDGLAADNQLTLPPLNERWVAIDREALPRTELALQAAGYLPVAPDTGTQIAATRQESEHAADIILLVDPEAPSCGLLTLGKRVAVRDARALQGLPQACAEGIAGAEVPMAQLPVGSTVWIEAIDTDGQAHPWAASWEWKNQRVIYLAGRPRSWTGGGAFPSTIALLLAEYSPPRESLPGAETSNTSTPIVGEATPPTLQAGAPAQTTIPLGNACLALALLALLPLLWRGYLRGRGAAS